MSPAIFLPEIALPRQADAAIRLYVPFTSNVATDLSPYAHSPTSTSATITGGVMSITGTTLQYITYGPSSALGHSAGEAYTIEGFVRWTSSANAQEPAPFYEYLVGSYYMRYGCYGNTGDVSLNTPDAPAPDATNFPAIPPPLSTGVQQHFAQVRPSGSGPKTLRFYIAGAQVFTFTEPAEQTNASGTFNIGKTVGASQAASYTLTGIKLTKREVYTGTSFTPPTP